MAVFGCTLQTMTTERDRFAAFRVELKRHREEAGLTPAQAAKKAGISSQRWANIERGYELKGGIRIPANPRRDNLIKMAKAVDMPVPHALGLAGEKTLDQAETRRISNQPRHELHQLINDLSVEQIEGLLHFVRTMMDPQATAAGGVVYRTPLELPDQREDNDKLSQS